MAELELVRYLADERVPELALLLVSGVLRFIRTNFGTEVVATNRREPDHFSSLGAALFRCSPFLLSKI